MESSGKKQNNGRFNFAVFAGAAYIGEAGLAADFSLKYNPRASLLTWGLRGSIQSSDFWLSEITVGLCVPVPLSKTILIPYVEGALGLAKVTALFDKTRSAITFGPSTHVGLMVMFNAIPGFIVKADYQYFLDSEDTFSNLEKRKNQYPAVNHGGALCVGYSF